MKIRESIEAAWRRCQRHPAAVAAALAALVVAAVLVVSLSRPAVPDFRNFEAGPERKSVFFDFTSPLVREANAQVREDREALLDVASEPELGWFDRRWLRDLADEYRVDYERPIGDETIETLLTRVDTVPVSLALAQAAKESGWGTSRFAREGYNFFGEWCFQPGCGLVPGSRLPGRTHEVESFDTPLDSVASYLHNLNTNRSYRELRKMRRDLRESGEPVTGLALADGLSRYSERGEAYVKEVRSLIRSNDLDKVVASEPAPSAQ